MPYRQDSIKNRVRAVIFLASAFVVLITAASFVVYEFVNFKEQLARNVSTLATVIADNVAAPLAFDNEDNALEILATLKAEPDIIAAAVYDQKEELFAKYPAGLQNDLLPARIEKKGFAFKTDAFILFQPVIKERKAIGTLYLRSSLRGMNERFWRYGLIVAAVLMSSLLAAFVLSSFLQSRISDPVLALTKTAEAISERGDYSIRAPKLTEDELGIFTDAFNRMLAETQEHQARLGEQARLLDLTNDGISVRDIESRVTYWNHGAEELYGFTSAEALGKIMHELLRTEFPEPLKGIEEKILEKNRWFGEVIQTRKDGSKLHVASRWSLMRDANGRPVSVLETNTDISERKAFQASLERLVQERTAKLQDTIGELEAFSYSVSHDMRAPLRAMQGYAKALSADYSANLDSEAKDYLERISRASNRLDLLIQDVLAYSKVAKGDITLHPVDLETLLEDVLPNHPEFQPPRARIKIDRPLLRVLGHEAYLTQCITNLLGNAVKFVAPGVIPEVRIRTERFGTKARLWFEDNGIGISPAHQERIFQIFGQVYPQKTYGGTGIGLAIVRKAAQRMNGEAGVESEAGKGSRFWIILNEAPL